MDLKLLLRAQWDRVAAVGCMVLGAVALLIGWIGVSGNALVYKQLAYIVSGGLFGIALVGVGTTLLLTAALADEWRKLDRVEDALRGRLADVGNAEPDVPEPVVPARRTADEASGDVLASTRTLRRAPRSTFPS